MTATYTQTVRPQEWSTSVTIFAKVNSLSTVVTQSQWQVCEYSRITTKTVINISVTLKAPKMDVSHASQWLTIFESPDPDITHCCSSPSCKMEHFPQASWWSSRGSPGQLKGPQNEHEESGRISGIWKQLSTFTNWQMQEQFVVATTLRPRGYRARYLDRAIQGPTARQDADEAERARWIQVLADMLKATRTSMSQLLSTSMKLLRGGRAVSTLRFRVGVLRRFLSLLALNHQQVYLQLTEYLQVKLEEPRSRAGLKNTHQAYSFLEEMAGVPSEQRFTISQLYYVVHQELLA